MRKHSDEQLVTIGRAVDLLQQEFPDVTVSSLRFLEREGLLSPERKPGGHRVYNLHDMRRARRIKQWQAERKSLKEIRDLLETTASAEDLDVVVSGMTSHLLDGDIPNALAQLYSIHEAGVSLLDICDRVLTPVLQNLGDDQGNHLIPVDMQFELDEHLVRFFATATVPPANPVGKPVVLACVPIWERHDMPVRMLSALLEERGATVHFLGSIVDQEFVLNAMERLIPDVILVSMTVTPEARESEEWFGAVISAMSPAQHLLIGGMSANAMQHFEAENVACVGTASFPAIIEHVMGFGT